MWAFAQSKIMWKLALIAISVKFITYLKDKKLSNPLCISVVHACSNSSHTLVAKSPISMIFLFNSNSQHAHGNSSINRKCNSSTTIINFLEYLQVLEMITLLIMVFSAFYYADTFPYSKVIRTREVSSGLLYPTLL